jgi:hypothetical protein
MMRLKSLFHKQLTVVAIALVCATGAGQAQTNPVRVPTPVPKPPAPTSVVSAAELARERQQLVSLGLQPDDGGVTYGWAPIQGGVLTNQSFYQTTSISYPSGRIWVGWGFSAQNGILYDLVYSIVVPTRAPHAKIFQGVIPGF